MTLHAAELDAAWVLVSASTLVATLMITTGLLREFFDICRGVTSRLTRRRP